MRSLGKREWVGLAILAGLVVVWFVGGGNSENSQRGIVPGLPGPGAGRSDVPIPVVDVHLELLEGRHEDAAEPVRDLFRFQRAAAAPALGPAPVSAPRGGQAVAPAPVSAGPPPPPTIPLRFIGVLEAPGQVGGRVAVLSDGRGNVFYGKEGDIVEGRYRMLTIGPDTAELAYTDGSGRQTIRLTGQ